MRRRGLAALVLVVVAAAAPAAACRCAQRPLAAYFAAAELVVVGLAVETWIDTDAQRRRVRFDVPTAYKGDAAALAGFATPLHSASCGAAIEVGRRYVVFASQRPHGDGVAWFDTCGGTRALDAGSEEVAPGFVDATAADVVPRLTVLRNAAGADPRTSATPGLPQPGDPRAVLIGLLALPGLLPAGDAGTPAPARPLRVYGRPALDAPVLATIRAPGQLRTREYAYEAPGAVVRERREGWYRIALADGGDAWVRAADAGTFHPLHELLRDRLTYLGPHWDGWVWPDPGAGHPQAARRSEGREQPVRVVATDRIGDTLWLQVEVLDRSPCDGGDVKVVHGGWVPAYTAAGELVAWFHSRGC